MFGKIFFILFTILIFVALFWFIVSNIKSIIKVYCQKKKDKKGGVVDNESLQNNIDKR